MGGRRRNAGVDRGVSREEYIELLRDLLNRDNSKDGGGRARVREANQRLFSLVVQDADPSDTMDADMALAEATVAKQLRGGAKV